MKKKVGIRKKRCVEKEETSDRDSYSCYPSNKWKVKDLVIEFNIQNNSFLAAVLAELNILYMHMLYSNFNAKFGVYSLHSCSE